MINNRQNGRRGRGRGGVRPINGGGGGANTQERGNRIDNRARGNASQLHEKYKTLARDAQTQGDRVMIEYYLQFADHYFRVLNESRSRFEEQRRQPGNGQEEYDDGDDNGEMNGAEADPRFDDQPRYEQPRYEQQQRPDRQDRPVQRDRDDQAREQRRGRDDGQRDGNRENGNRENPNRDNGNRENGNRDEGNRENGRDGNRDAQNRENTHRDNANRDGQGRDNGARDGNREPRYERAYRDEPRTERADTPPTPLPTVSAESVPTDGEPVRRPRGRPRRVPVEAAEPRFDGDRLPPSFLSEAIVPIVDVVPDDAGASAEGGEDQPRRRRVRRPRSDAADAVTVDA